MSDLKQIKKKVMCQIINSTLYPITMARKLYCYGKISESVYDRIKDRMCGDSAQTRRMRLIDNSEHCINFLCDVRYDMERPDIYQTLKQEAKLKQCQFLEITPCVWECFNCREQPYWRGKEQTCKCL